MPLRPSTLASEKEPGGPADPRQQLVLEEADGPLVVWPSATDEQDHELLQRDSQCRPRGLSRWPLGVRENGRVEAIGDDRERLELAIELTESLTVTVRTYDDEIANTRRTPLEPRDSRLKRTAKELQRLSPRFLFASFVEPGTATYGSALFIEGIGVDPESAARAGAIANGMMSANANARVVGTMRSPSSIGSAFAANTNGEIVMPSLSKGRRGSRGCHGQTTSTVAPARANPTASPYVRFLPPWLSGRSGYGRMLKTLTGDAIAAKLAEVAAPPDPALQQRADRCGQELQEAIGPATP